MTGRLCVAYRRRYNLTGGDKNDLINPREGAQLVRGGQETTSDALKRRKREVCVSVRGVYKLAVSNRHTPRAREAEKKGRSEEGGEGEKAHDFCVPEEENSDHTKSSRYWNS